MPFRARDDALSEVVGFVLLLGIIVVALSLYQLYGVPAVGRENEILHMNAVKDRFIDYKIALDGLWLGSVYTNRTTEGVTLSTLFDLGTEGGYTQGGGALFPVLAPIPSGGKVSVNEHQDTLTITRNGENVIAPYPMGEVAYESSNNYWIRQRYAYQMGGLFLEQDSGTAVRLSPLVSLYKANASTEASPGDYRLRVKITAIQIFGNQSTAGQGVARVDTRLREGVTEVPAVSVADEEENITVTVDAYDEQTARAWRQAFIDAAKREGVALETEGGPVRIDWDEDTRVSMICCPGGNAKAVDLDIIRVNFTVTLQQAIMV